MRKECEISCKMAFCCLLPLGKLVGGEGSSVIGGQRDQVVEDPGTLVIVVMIYRGWGVQGKMGVACLNL